VAGPTPFRVGPATHSGKPENVVEASFTSRL
jgi:hypothetical protein